MIKTSKSRHEIGWPQSEEDLHLPVTEKGKMVSRRSLVKLGGEVGATRSQRTMVSPCTTNFGRGGEVSANLCFNRVHW
jgi:hypothetical protein